MKTSLKTFIENTFSSVILNNSILQELEKKGFIFEYINLKDDYDIFTYYIVDFNFTIEEIIEKIENTNQVFIYNEDLDLYILGVTSFGTPYEGVEA